MSQYDKNHLAKEYYEHRDVEHPLRRAAYGTWLAECGDIAGKRILDLGCGAGESSRRLELVGARKIIGVDDSKEMLNEAKRIEKENPRGIKYQFGDITQLNQYAESFELITACYVFHYLKVQELEEAIASASRNLKSERKLVAINQNPDLPVWHKQGDNKGLFYPYTETWLDEPFKLNSKILIEWYSSIEKNMQRQ